jgi:hypothetical protein
VSENDKPLTPDHVKLQVFINDQTNTVQVEFSGFEDHEDCEKYAEFLTNTLPLLLYETKQIQ